jgi:hypothetical protein
MRMVEKPETRLLVSLTELLVVSVDGQNTPVV